MDSMMSSLMVLLGISGIIQGLGMKYSKSVRKKLKIDSEKVDKRYINLKASFLILAGIIILLIQLAVYFQPQLEDKLYILLSAFLLASITADMIYRRRKIKKARKTMKNNKH